MLQPLNNRLLLDYAAEPAYPRVFRFEPPLALWDNRLFKQGHPFSAYALMRENAPVCWCREGEMTGGGFWALTRYDDVRKVSLDAATFSSQKGGILLSYGKGDMPQGLLRRASIDAMINLDAPVHLKLRREHMPFFTPGYVADLKRRVEAKVTALLDSIAPLGSCDLVEHISAELPLFTLSEILGLPEADRPKLVRWMHFLEIAGTTAAEQSFGTLDPNFFADFQNAIEEMFDYGQSVLLERRRNPRADLLSAIANISADGDLLSREYLDGSWLLIVFAGNDTTRNSISGTMRLLTENPDQKRVLQAGPELIPNMVHEAIRLVTPVIYMRRTATRDTALRGQKIAEGEKVMMYCGAANRDPELFPDPDRFDVRRANAKEHIAFGIGAHVCLGQRIANMQLEAVYRQILARFPDMRWTGEIDIAPNNFVHAIRKLGVAFTPET